MNTKKLVLFGGAAVIVAAVLVYSLGIYPPSSARNGQGAIGQRQVYRADQPADASVSPGAAPVAMEAQASQLKKGQIVQLQNGQFMQLSNGGFALRLNNGNLLALNNAQFARLTSAQFARLNDGLTANLQAGQIMKVSADQFVFQMNGDRFVGQLTDGMFLKLNSGLYVGLTSGGFALRDGMLMQLTANQLQANMIQR
jgi:hypothetical protein